MRLYNTLSRQVEDFAPADGRTVRMYTCGPTVYNPAHLGNFRTFLFEDLMRRTLRLRGWEVRQVMNLTDVDDKIIKRAREQGKTITEVTEPVVEIFHRDREFLRIEAAEAYPKATEYVPQMIALVERLMAKDVAYQAEDGSIYFAIARFPEYGRLSRLDTRELKAGARVSQDEYSKENAQDFALWKAATPEDEAAGSAWDSPWGRGHPGWHLECSAMAMSLLGETIDLHCGGIDLVFPHHEDEIAQSEAATGKTFARVWCHGGFLLTEGTKMAKRLGNVWTVLDLRREGVPPAAVRYLYFSTHYRKELNLAADAVEAAIEAVRRIGNFKLRVDAATGGTPGLAAAAERAEEAAKAALFDDLNAPEALAALMTLISEANAELDRVGTDAAALERARRAFATIDGVLDVTPAVRSGVVRVEDGEPRELADLLAAAPAAGDDGREAWIAEMLGSRQRWRQARQFGKADAIRAALIERGVQVEDTPQGARWTVMS